MNAAQSEALRVLGEPRSNWPNYPLESRDELREDLETRLAPLLETIESDSFDEDNLYLSKHKLSQILGCERKLLGERDEPFEWSIPTARGTVTHKAIELSINWQSDPLPLELVDEAIERLSDSDASIGEFLRICGEAERAELRAAAGATVEQFQTCFPPLKAVWRPTLESPIRIRLHDGRIVLSGKPDLMLGQPEGDKAGKVIIDFKTGRFSPLHAEDLRFYALLEALRVLPPRRVATYYLDEARLHPEDVTLDLLDSAMQRVVDAAFRYVELVSQQRSANVIPGPACRWCSVLTDCDTGRAYLDEGTDAGSDHW